MDDLWWKTPIKLDDLGVPPFSKHPFINFINGFFPAKDYFRSKGLLHQQFQKNDSFNSLWIVGNGFHNVLD